MRQTAKFDYYYGMQAEAYSFYRIPKVLFTSPYFKDLSCEAKVLYGLMLDRMALSIKNRWYDEEGRVYIIFSIEDVKEYMGCCQWKAVKLVNELDKEKGIGLIEKKRLGFGKSNTIYVKNFILQEEPDILQDIPTKATEAVVCDEENEGPEADTCSKRNLSEDSNNSKNFGEEVSGKSVEYSEEAVESQKFKNRTSRNSKIEFQEVQKSNFQKYENRTSRSSKSKLQEIRKLDSNYNNSSNTDFIENESNLSIHDRIEQRKQDRDEMDMKDVREAYEDLIMENIGFSELCAQYGLEHVTEVLELLLDTVCTGKKKIIIGGEPISTDIVKSRLLKLDFSHIQYVFECLEKNTTKVRNIRQYLLTALYNAPATISHYYSAEVNHDLYGSNS